MRRRSYRGIQTLARSLHYFFALHFPRCVFVSVSTHTHGLTRRHTHTLFIVHTCAPCVLFCDCISKYARECLRIYLSPRRSRKRNCAFLCASVVGRVCTYYTHYTLPEHNISVYCVIDAKAEADGLAHFFALQFQPLNEQLHYRFYATQSSAFCALF